MIEAHAALYAIQKDITDFEFRFLSLLINCSGSNGYLLFPDWERLKDVGSYTDQQLNRTVKLLTVDDVIRTSSVLIGRTEPNTAIHIRGMSEMPEESPLRHKALNHGKRQAPVEGYVYLIHGVDTPWYKIGVTVDITKRIKAFNTQGPFKCELISYAWCGDSYDYESALHMLYAEYRVEGEWFALPDSIVEQIVEGFKTPFEMSEVKE